MADDPDITTVLRDASAGGRGATDELVRRLYEPLRGLAHRRLGRERADHTLGTTGLVHEAYLKLVDTNVTSWADRAHFLAAASRVMRNVLVDHARARRALKRGGGAAAEAYDDRVHGLTIEQAGVVEDLHEALTRFDSVSPRQARLLELRYFGGLTLDECAAALDVSRATITRDLRLARAWLASELDPEAGAAA